MHDLIIIGAGPAGLTAALYAGRKKMNTLVISPEIGGQINYAKHLENYPGAAPQSGFELIQKFEQQAKSFGAKLLFGQAVKIEKKKPGFQVTLSDKKTHQSKTLILAFGRISQRLKVPGEEKFLGKGISTCTVCDAPLFKDKIVAVIGGGNSAFHSALELTKFVKKVYLIHRREEFKGDAHLLNQIKKNKKVEILLNSIPTEIKGKQFVSSITIKNLQTQKVQEIPLEGVFLEIGYEVDTSLIKNLVKTNEKNEIIIDPQCQTSCPGIFAAGDLTNTPFRQVIIAAGEGAKAALSAHEYFLKVKNKKILNFSSFNQSPFHFF